MFDTPHTSFKAGQFVQRKAGGPTMEYMRQDELGLAMCSWVVDGRTRREGFPAKELRLTPIDYSMKH